MEDTNNQQKQKNAIELLSLISIQQDEDVKQGWGKIDGILLKNDSTVHKETSQMKKNGLQLQRKDIKPQIIFRKRSENKLSPTFKKTMYNMNRFKSFQFDKLVNFETKKKNSLLQNESIVQKQEKGRKNCNEPTIQECQTKQFKGQEITSKLRTTGSEDYILKITKFSYFNKKQTVQSPSGKKFYQIQYGTMDKTIQSLNEQLKTKIKTKISHKLRLKNKQSSQRLQQQCPKKPHLLENWLESSRYRRRRSVACLLRQLFNSKAKAQEQQRKQPKNFTIRSARYVSLTEGNQKIE